MERIGRHREGETEQGDGDASAQRPAPGRETLVQRLAGGATGGGVDIGHKAAEGVAGGGGKLPHLDLIQRSFGPEHDVTGVSAHVGGKAAEAAGQIGAHAYATGNSVAFAQQPDLHTAAHEAAHVVQQRAGVHLKGGVGEAGDAHEQHADAVADRVVRGDSAADLLSSGRGAAGASTGVQLVPDPAEVKKLLKELDDAIAAGKWEVLRARVYPREAAAARTRANDRRAGKIPDLAGLGSVKSLDAIAAAFKALQGVWTTKSPKERAKAMIDAGDAALVAAKVPKYLDHEIVDMVPRGSFGRGGWKFNIRKATVDAAALTDTEAGEAANTVAHESRHAEQHFLRARYIAGTGKNAAAVEAATGVHSDIAVEAVKQKMDPKDPRIAEAKTMDKAFGADGASNQAISNNVTAAIGEMDTKRATAVTARATLAGSATATTFADGKTALAELKTKTAAVETAYLAYRAIPYEADAHEVGDSESEAFSKLP